MGRRWQKNEAGWRRGASDDVDGRGGSRLLEVSVKISGPLGEQLSSITRRIQLQREAERDTASICHTAAAGKSASREGGGRRRETGREERSKTGKRSEQEQIAE